MASVWRQQLGRSECPYAERWVLDARVFSIRLHHFRRSDDARALHDHGWAFLTVVLRGGYADLHPVGPCAVCGGSSRSGGTSGKRLAARQSCSWCSGLGYTLVGDRLRPGSVRYRRAHHRHTVRVDPGGAWTLVLTGPETRRWGFWMGDRFVPHRRYFFERGHHPCEQP